MAVLGPAWCGFGVPRATEQLQGGSRRRELHQRGPVPALRMDDFRSQQAADRRPAIFDGLFSTDEGSVNNNNINNGNGNINDDNNNNNNNNVHLLERHQNYNDRNIGNGVLSNYAANMCANPSAMTVSGLARAGRSKFKNGKSSGAADGDMFQMDFGNGSQPEDDEESDGKEDDEDEHDWETSSEASSQNVQATSDSDRKTTTATTTGGSWSSIPWRPPQSGGLRRPKVDAAANQHEQQQRQQMAGGSLGMLMRNLSEHIPLPSQQRLGDGMKVVFGSLMRSLSGHRFKPQRDTESRDLSTNAQGPTLTKVPLNFSPEEISKRVEVVQRPWPIKSQEPMSPRGFVMIRTGANGNAVGGGGGGGGVTGSWRQVAKSAPVAVPQRRGKGHDFDDDEDGAFIPPHEFVSRRESKKDPLKFANPSPGRLKGLSSIRFRNKVLTTTGFFDGDTEQLQRSPRESPKNVDWFLI